MDCPHLFRVFPVRQQLSIKGEVIGVALPLLASEPKDEIVVSAAVVLEPQRKFHETSGAERSLPAPGATDHGSDVSPCRRGITTIAVKQSLATMSRRPRTSGRGTDNCSSHLVAIRYNEQLNTSAARFRAAARAFPFRSFTMSSATSDRSEQQSSPKSQRDAKGRFVRNNDGGPGNPFGRRVAELRKILLRSATEENVERLANMLMEKAFAGDLAAAKLLLLYWIGKPKEVADPDRQDVEEWELAQQSIVRPEVVQEACASLPITVGLVTLPAINKVRELEVQDALLHPEKYAEEPEDELTPEELAEEAEMIREMRAAREEAEAAGAATSATAPILSAATTGRVPSSPASGEPACATEVRGQSYSQEDEAFALAALIAPATGAAAGSPSRNGGDARAARPGTPGAGPVHGATKRAG
jgi:hypothetical protein